MAEAGRAVAALAAGVETLAGVLARTYGPVAGPVLVASGGSRPEVVDDSGVLARRITGLDDRRRQAGVMALRSACLVMRRRYGDGSAMTAVLARAMVAPLARLVVAGASPVELRRGVSRGVDAACAALDAAAVPVDDADELRRLAIGACHDESVGTVLAELFSVLGPRAALIVEEREVPGVDRRYVDGARWRARPAFDEALAPGSTELAAADPVIMVADDVLSDAADIVPALEHALAVRRPLVLVARGVEGEVKRTLQRNRARLAVVPVRLAALDREVADDLADLAVLTGATLLAAAVGRPPRSVRAADFGSARHVVGARRHLTVSGGAGAAAEVAEAATALEARAHTVERGSEQWRALRMRIARLGGAQGVIVIGGYTETERQRRAETVGQAQRVLELAVVSGAVAGGGAALLGCVDAVRSVRADCASPEEGWGVDVVAGALDAPMRQLVTNFRTHHDAPHPGTVVARATELGVGWGFDTNQGGYVPMAKTGILDAAGVVAAALRAAGSLAGSLVTTAAVVRGRAA